MHSEGGCLLDLLENRKTPLWIKIFSSLPAVGGLIAILLTLPWCEQHIGIALNSVILWGFLFWLLRSLLAGRYESQQGCYNRYEKPFRYWIHIVFLVLFSLLLGLGWVHNIGLVRII